MPFDAEELARAVLVRVIPRRRYRIAAPSDARFASFAASATRVAYRQQGADPSLLIFAGADHDVRAAALAAASWAESNWRPNAVQRSVRPGVVVVQVGPPARLAKAGAVEGAAVPAAIWTVDSETGRAETPSGAPGAPPAGEVRAAASALARGAPPPSLGELDYAEREVMHGRRLPMPPVISGVGGLLVLLFAVRYGLSVFSNLVSWLRLARAGGPAQLVAAGFVVTNALLLAGIALGAALLLNLGDLAYRAPGFSSGSPRVRRATWAGYVLAMLVLVVLIESVLPRALRSALGR